MDTIEVPRQDLWILGSFLLFGGLAATIMMVFLLRRAWNRLQVEKRKPLGAPERILAEEEWGDAIDRLVLVLTTTSVGALLGIGLLFGDIHLQGIAGFILAGIFVIQGGIPLRQQVRSLRAQQRLLEAIRLLRFMEGHDK